MQPVDIFEQCPHPDISGFNLVESDAPNPAPQAVPLLNCSCGNEECAVVARQPGSPVDGDHRSFLEVVVDKLAEQDRLDQICDTATTNMITRLEAHEETNWCEELHRSARHQCYKGNERMQRSVHFLS